jgi:hypothetical protein
MLENLNKIWLMGREFSIKRMGKLFKVNGYVINKFNEIKTFNRKMNVYKFNIFELIKFLNLLFQIFK